MHSLIRDHLKTSAALTATDARIAARLRGTLIRSPAEALLLSVLADDRLGAAYGLQELSARAAVCSPNASRMVAHAVACGLMLREACPGDGRAVSITITDKGVRELMKAGLVYA